MRTKTNGWVTEGNIGTCKHCGAEIVWYKSNSDKWIPMNCSDKKFNRGFAIGGDFHKCGEVSKYKKQELNKQYEVTYKILVENSKGFLVMRKVKTELLNNRIELTEGQWITVNDTKCIVKENDIDAFTNKQTLFLATEETNKRYEEFLKDED